MATPYSSGMGCKSAVLNATAGTQLGVCQASLATASVPAIQGQLHTITTSADTATETISVYDGTSTAGTLKAQIVLETTPTPHNFILDIQFDIGIFVVVTGAGSPVVTIAFT